MSTKREAMLEYLTCRREDLEYRDMIFTGLNPRTVKLDAQICERPNFFTGYDAFGVHWTRAIPASHRTPGQEPVLKDIGDWPGLKVPDVDRFCWDGLKEAADQARAEDKLVSVTLLMGAFERASVLMEFEDCLVAALMEPEEFSGLIGKIRSARWSASAGRPILTWSTFTMTGAPLSAPSSAPSCGGRSSAPTLSVCTTPFIGKELWCASTPAARSPNWCLT